MNIKMGLRGMAVLFVVWVLGVALLGEEGVANGFNGPDLFIENVSINPPIVKAGEPLTIRATVTNDGRTEVEERFDVTVKVNGSRIATFRVRFNFTQTRNLETTWTAEEGEHLITIEVDEPRDQIDECDERNNKYEQTVSVAPDSNLTSFNRSALEGQAAGWLQASEALRIETSSTNLLLLLDLVQQGFDAFSEAMGIISSVLEPLQSQWPASFSDDNAYAPLLVHYSTIQLTADSIRGGLDTLDLDTAIAAMGEMETAFRDLAALSSPQAPLEKLAEAADALFLANEAALSAQASFSNQGGADDDIADLISEVRALGDILAQVANDMTAAAEAQSVKFLDVQGQALTDLTNVGTLNFSTTVTGLRLELVNFNGTPVVDLSTEDSVLGWNLTDAQGNPLPTGSYFYRVTGLNFVDVGSMLIP